MQTALPHCVQCGPRTAMRDTNVTHTVCVYAFRRQNHAANFRTHTKQISPPTCAAATRGACAHSRAHAAALACAPARAQAQRSRGSRVPRAREATRGTRSTTAFPGPVARAHVSARGGEGGAAAAPPPPHAAHLESRHYSFGERQRATGHALHGPRSAADRPSRQVGRHGRPLDRRAAARATLGQCLRGRSVVGRRLLAAASVDPRRLRRLPPLVHRRPVARARRAGQRRPQGGKHHAAAAAAAARDRGLRRCARAAPRVTCPRGRRPRARR